MAGGEDGGAGGGDAVPGRRYNGNEGVNVKIQVTMASS